MKASSGAYRGSCIKVAPLGATKNFLVAFAEFHPLDQAKHRSDAVVYVEYAAEQHLSGDVDQHDQTQAMKSTDTSSEVS